jgi:hypothetical protein
VACRFSLDDIIDSRTAAHRYGSTAQRGAAYPED